MLLCLGGYAECLNAEGVIILSVIELSFEYISAECYCAIMVRGVNAESVLILSDI